MNFLKALQTQLSATWQRYNVRQRAMLMVALGVGAVAIIGVGAWSARSEYVVLANQLGPSEAAELISRLQSTGIDYKLSYSGSEVMVPAQDLSRARLAGGDMLDPMYDSEGMTGGGIFDDPNVIRLREQRNRETSIARSIMRMKGIAHADVHLSQPDPSPFVRDRIPKSASVVVALKPGTMFSRQQAAAVVSLVAHSVEGLNPNDITLVDNDGRILSDERSPTESGISMQFEYTRRLETELAAKAETMLAQVLGPGRAVVRVAADVDFTQTTREEQTYDPDAKVKKSEKITTEDTTNQEQSLGGAGAKANIEANAATTKTAGAQTSKSETIETEYENTKIVNTTVIPSGRLQRLTVSAAVDIPQPAGGGVAMSEDAVKNIIKQAVGFDEERDGENAIAVVVGPLAGMTTLEDGELGGTGWWKEYEGLVRNASLGIASLVVLAIVLLTLKKVRPVVVTPPMNDGLSLESSRRLSAIAQRVEDDPEEVARMLETWLGEDENERTGSARAAA